MVLSLRRRKIAPMPRRDFDRSMQQEAVVTGAPAAPGDDYLVEGEEQAYRPSVVNQTAQLLQMVMIGVIAVLSLAIFWLVGTVLNIF